MTTNATSTAATDRQIAYIIRLCNQLTGDRAAHLSQVRKVIGISSSKAGRGLSKTEASAIIDELLERTNG